MDVTEPEPKPMPDFLDAVDEVIAAAFAVIDTVKGSSFTLPEPYGRLLRALGQLEGRSYPLCVRCASPQSFGDRAPATSPPAGAKPLASGIMHALGWSLTMAPHGEAFWTRHGQELVLHDLLREPDPVALLSLLVNGARGDTPSPT